MVGEMVERRNQSDAGNHPMAAFEEDHRCSDARSDDPHILDCAVGEQAFHLGLGGGVEDADEG